MQPVATVPARSRSPQQLVREIHDRTLVPDSVTHQEERAILAHFKARELAIIARIERKLAAEGRRSSEREAGKLRLSLSGRYLALWRSKPKDLADRGTDPAELRAARRAARIGRIIARLDEMKELDRPARARVFVRPKMHRDGTPRREKRILFSFGWTDKARQRLIARSLAPFARFHPSQFLLQQTDWGRGRSAVCEYLRHQLPTLADDWVFLQLDVRNFFGSISAEWLESHRYGLPLSVIRRQVHTGEMILSPIGKMARAYLRGGDEHELVRHVLPQGSALASLMAEMAMAEVLWGLADRLANTCLITYSDNLGIIVPRTEAAAIEGLLRASFAASGAGPFEIHASAPPVPLSRDFQFLGHRWRVRDGEVQTYVPQHVASARAVALIEQIMTADLRTLVRIVGRARAQVHEWRLWPGVVAWERNVMHGINSGFGALQAQQRLATS